ncbi:integrator complex subunit 3-like [Anneissia japonica]|uniref:integrator complex subunit 3-like n=1 Tax=Anneissia japonica TaxID=1529436 RepID=UPI0014256F46|nr:integrator complex subunit 3-like [Anneissia japonica]
MDEKKTSVKSKLFISTIIETKDELEERMERGYESLTKLTTDLSEREAHDALNAAACKSMQQHEEITLGLLYSILTNPAAASKSYRDLTLVSRDGMATAWARLNQIIIERYPKLVESARTQVVWYTKEMVNNGVTGVDNVCSSLIKQIAGGDVSPKNVWLAENLLDIFTEKRAWLDKYPVLTNMALYTYLRIIEDHSSPMLVPLRQREVDFCISLLRSKFSDCCRIGRDLLRLLQNVARIPEFEKLWTEILHSPQTLSSNPQFTGIMQLLSQRTSPKYLACRLTPDMEKKLVFLTSKVKFGQQKRYQDWFQKQYLSTPESQSLRCDLIRYICGVVHPSNDILCSDVIQRWAVIGWLLTTCTSNVAASSAKLALFYDWLVFSSPKGNIMDIEPAILVMHHSMRSHPAITATLLDFLCRIIANFYPPLEAQIRQGVFNSLRAILEKRVLSSLSPLFDNSKLDKELRSMIRENFSEFCTPETPPAVKEPAAALDAGEPMQKDDDTAAQSNHKEETVPEFSDEEEDERMNCKVDEMTFRPINEEEEEDNVDIESYLEQIDGNLKDICEQLYEQRDTDMERQCELIENLCSVILDTDSFDADTAGPLAMFLCTLYKTHFTSELLPQDINEESIEDSIGKPIFVIFRNLNQENEDELCPVELLTLVCCMYEKQKQIGYHLLYFLQASKKSSENKLAVYEEVCKNTELKDLSKCLVKDFKTCEEDDPRLMCYLIQPVYANFPDATVKNIELLNIVAGSLDSAQLQDLICEIMEGCLEIFKKDSVASVLDHPEALASILLMLKLERCTLDFLRPVLCRVGQNGDRFATAILCNWIIQDEQHIAEQTKTLMMRSTTSNKRIRQRTNPKLQNPTPPQILAHLDALRQAAGIRQTMFFSQEPVLQGLQHIQKACTDAQKTKYSDLFALVDFIEDSSRSTRSGRGTRRSPGVTSPRNKKQVSNNDNSSSDSEENEEVTKPKPKKRKKSTVAAGSDSD